jgi:hypothetical protein
MNLRTKSERKKVSKEVTPEPKRNRTPKVTAQVKISSTRRSSRVTKAVGSGSSARRITAKQRESIAKRVEKAYGRRDVVETKRKNIKRARNDSDDVEQRPVAKRRKVRELAPTPEDADEDVVTKPYRRRVAMAKAESRKHTITKRRKRANVIPDSDGFDEDDVLKEPKKPKKPKSRKRALREDTDEAHENDVPSEEEDDMSSARYVYGKEHASKRPKCSTEHDTSKSTSKSRRAKSAVKHTKAVLRTLSILPTEPQKLGELTELICAQKWDDMDNIPAAIKDACDNVPALIPAEKCWAAGKPPLSALELVSEAVLNLKSDQYVIEDTPTAKAVKKPIKDVITQLFDPPLEGPLIAHNLPIIDEDKFSIDAISDKVTPPADEHIFSGMNVTPANTVVDIHIDQGTNGLSIGIGKAEDPWQIQMHKVWLFWPPTEHNLTKYEELKRSRVLRLLKMDEFEHGIITAFGIHHGVFIPAGWLHATITTRSGFLSGININSPDTILMASKIKSMDLRVTPNDVSQHLYNFQDAIEVALDASISDSGSTLDDAFQGWYEVESALRGVRLNMSHHRSQCSKILAAWSNALQRHPELDSRCCACWEGRGEVGAPHGTCCSCRSKKKNWRKHFWVEHLGFMKPKKYVDPDFVTRK